MVVADGGFDVLGDDHGARLALELFAIDHFGNEVVEHDLGFGLDGAGVVLDVGAQLFLGFGAIEYWVIGDGFLDFVVAAVGGVIGEHIEDEAFFNGLLHGVKMEWMKAAIGLLIAEFFQRGIFRGGGESEVRSVASHFACAHGFEDLVLGVLGVAVLAHGLVHLVVRRAALRAVGFVDDDGEAFGAQIADAGDDDREFLNGGDDDLLALFERGFELGRFVRGGDELAHRREVFNVIAQLAVEDAAVGYHDDAIE